MYLGKFGEFVTLTRAVSASQLTIELIEVMRSACLEVICDAQKLLFSPTRSSADGFQSAEQLRDVLDALRLFRERYVLLRELNLSTAGKAAASLQPLLNPASAMPPGRKLVGREEWSLELHGVQSVNPDLGVLPFILRRCQKEQVSSHIPAALCFDSLDRVIRLLEECLPFYACAATIPGHASDEVRSLMEVSPASIGLFPLDLRSRTEAAMRLEKLRQAAQTAVIVHQQTARVSIELPVQEFEPVAKKVGETEIFQEGRLLASGNLVRNEQRLPMNPPALLFGGSD